MIHPIAPISREFVTPCGSLAYGGYSADAATNIRLHNGRFFPRSYLAWIGAPPTCGDGKHPIDGVRRPSGGMSF